MYVLLYITFNEEYKNIQKKLFNLKNCLFSRILLSNKIQFIEVYNVFFLSLSRK